MVEFLFTWLVYKKYIINIYLKFNTRLWKISYDYSNEKKLENSMMKKKDKWYFSVVDIVWALTEQDDYQLSRNYCKVLKNRLIKEWNQLVTICNQLKMKWIN